MGWLDGILGRDERQGGGQTRAGEITAPPHRPRVLLDVEHRDSLFYLVLENHGDDPALDVKTGFDRPLGVERNEADLSELPAFTEVPYMVPGKTVEVFFGTATELLPKDRDAGEVTATVTYRDTDGRRYADTVTHDLEIYRHAGSVTRA